MELNQSKDGTYLGEWKPREEAAEGPVELVLPESEHATEQTVKWQNLRREVEREFGQPRR